MTNKQRTLEQTINEFNADFSNQKLDEVMRYFSSDATFRGLDGKVAHGESNIRKAFKRLFDGAYGDVVFMPKNLVIDEDKNEASFVWDCQHKLNTKPKSGMINKLLFSLMKIMYGNSFYWEGIDYFIFDENHKIVSKQSYGKSTLPKFIRGLAN